MCNQVQHQNEFENPVKRHIIEWRFRRGPANNGITESSNENSKKTYRANKRLEKIIQLLSELNENQFVSIF